MKTIHPKIIRQIFVLLLILLLGSLIFEALLPYLSGVLGAVTMYVLLRQPMATLLKKNWHPNLVAALLLFASFVCILIPIAGIVWMLGNKIGRAVQNSEKVITAIKEQLAQLEAQLGFELTSQIDSAAVSSWLSKNLQGFAGGTFNMFIAVALMYFLLFYMLTKRRKLHDSLFNYIPVGKKNLNIIGQEITAMVRSNALGIPLVAIAQGIVALIGFLIFGTSAPFFWAVIVTIGSMVPFIGAFLGIIPVFILSLSAGNPFQAWGILLYGFIVVGTTDNLIRLFILRKLDNVHPLITLIGVIIGVPIFGFIGLIFGPLLVSLFLLIVDIYTKEYGRNLSGKQ
jgi:predicted PurR-regulated permease PerM